MLALRFTDGEAGPRLERDRPVPEPKPGEALVRVLRAGICATDLEIVRGYVPGYASTLCHEFVGVVVRTFPPAPAWEGVRVVGEINCVLEDEGSGNTTQPPPPPPPFSIPPSPGAAAATLTPAPDPAPAMARNHAPGRTVLGIIGRDGCAAEYVALPLTNLHALPADPTLLSDARACFVEPLAAACRVAEQGLVRPGESVAVVGDGRLGLLLAGILSVAANGEGGQPPPPPPLAGTTLTHFGRHASKLRLVPGAGSTHATVVVPRDDDAAAAAAVLAPHAGAFDVVVEASRGGPAGAVAAAAMLKPGGRLVLKSTCAPPASKDGDRQENNDPSAAAAWAAFTTDLVVNEKAVAGSRCGPFPPALALLAGHPGIGKLVDAMISAEYDLEDGVAAFEEAARPGVVKVQLVTPAGRGGGG